MPKRRADQAAIVQPETLSYIRSISANLFLLMQANTDKTQAETALRHIIDDTNEELIRLGIEDVSHTKLPGSSEATFNGDDDEPQSKG